MKDDLMDVHSYRSVVEYAYNSVSGIVVAIILAIPALLICGVLELHDLGEKIERAKRDK